MTTQPGPVDPWAKWGWAFAAIWLVFLVYPVLAVLGADIGTPARVLTLGLILGFAVTNVLGYALPCRRSWLVLLTMVGLALATAPVIGIEAIAFTPYLAMLSALRLPDPAWKWAVGVWVLTPMLSLLRFEDFPPYFFLMVWPIMLGGVLIRVFGEKEQLADQAREELAVVSERDRVARDVHDVLGHSLTALSVKAELARRLLDVDPERARTELDSIQETARQALAEVRATVGGLRVGNLAAELEAAPRVLADAGVEAVVTGSVADTDPRHRTLLGWVLREAVTNVVRHARAERVTIALTRHGLTVTDDGHGIDAPAGHGLTGMRERVSGAGGTLTISGGSGTRLEVVLP